MKIQNTLNKQIYDITPEEWNVINNSGNAYKYKILDDGTPMEVKSMRENIVGIPVKKIKQIKK